jgi:hypothetical protein
MRVRLWAGLLALSACAAAGDSVNDVVSLVRSSIQQGQQDSQLAKALHRIKLAESLDQHSIEELENEGAGPKAIAELQRLRKVSAALPPAATTVQPRPAPPPGEQKRIVEMARESALNYTRSLPDFICTEVVRRYDDTRARLLDTLTLKLSYFEQKEKYQLLAINGRATVLPYESVGGVITQGEFGSLLAEVFDRQAAAEFRWDHWTTLRGRPAQVYSFRVPVARSHYRILVGNLGTRDETVAGQHGLVYVDGDTSQTVRIVSEADGIPRDFPVLSAATDLDYGFVEIGGRPFLLPLDAGVRMTTAQRRTRNEVEFHSYKKFASDATITYTEKQ